MLSGNCLQWMNTHGAVATILLQGARARGAQVPKFVVTKSSRSEIWYRYFFKAKLNKNYFLDSGDFDGLTSM